MRGGNAIFLTVPRLEVLGGSTVHLLSSGLAYYIGRNLDLCLHTSRVQHQFYVCYLGHWGPGDGNINKKYTVRQIMTVVAAFYCCTTKAQIPQISAGIV